MFPWTFQSRYDVKTRVPSMYSQSPHDAEEHSRDLLSSVECVGIECTLAGFVVRVCVAFASISRLFNAKGSGGLLLRLQSSSLPWNVRFVWLRGRWLWPRPFFICPYRFKNLSPSLELRKVSVAKRFHFLFWQCQFSIECLLKICRKKLVI